MRRIKLIWDFRGPEAKHIAQHHNTHLKEYAKVNKVEDWFTGVTEISSMYSIAYMVIKEENMEELREALRPHRGQVYLPI
ncbi:MAG: hypothetical protein KJP09_00540 [Bacteroidia bacterium]|nr:hypothetical protein [Bacteroidia bacterium]MBT8310485.1 hypothetical protein [Bacteroidia bacterium]NNK28754.1 hypothetical protein [Flavobacteriaceae bacterium]NNL60868.1 hypothetical protein [Flavobacteriaceae bacterium]RZV69937.1 MAG: hypothetical protein EX254_00870 [Flavobacteriaceae bacterium]